MTTSPMVIRPLQPEDFSAVSYLYGQTRPPGYSAPSADDPDQRRLVAEADGQVVGFISASTKDGSFKVLVAPPFQRKGIGTLLWKSLEPKIARLGISGITVWVREEALSAISWLNKQGFVQARLDGPVCLYTSEADLAPLESEALPKDVSIKTLGEELARDEQCLSKLFALSTELKRDVPGHDADETWEEFLRQQNEQERMPDAYFIAKHGSDYIGLSYLRARDSDIHLHEPNIVQQCLTGVLPSYRRQGIAKALKLRTIKYSCDHGSVRIFTNSDNPAMCALNANLGFHSGPWLVFAKAMAANASN